MLDNTLLKDDLFYDYPDLQRQMSYKKLLVQADQQHIDNQWRHYTVFSDKQSDQSSEKITYRLCYTVVLQ